MPELPKELKEALEGGELSMEQLRELIRLEAEALGFSFEEVLKRARERRLPQNHLGSDLQLLVEMLPA